MDERIHGKDITFKTLTIVYEDELEQLEQEMNLKFFGRGSRRFVEFNVDGLLRGDYKARMEGNSTAIQTGQLTPNEARAMDNREPMEGGERLFIQGATVPLETQEGQTNE